MAAKTKPKTTAEMDLEAVGKRLKSEIRRVGLTQTAIGAPVGLNQSQVSRFGRERTLQVENLIRFLEHCAQQGIDLTYVFGGVRRSELETITETRELRLEMAALRSELGAHKFPGPGHNKR